MSNYFLYFSIGVLVFLLIGFLIGFVRSWKRSLARFCINLGVLLCSLFLAPVIALPIINTFTHGSTFSGFGFTFDISVILSDALGQDVKDDLALAEGTTNALFTSILHVLINIVLFLIMFILFSILALIIYWIVCGVIGHKRKKQGQEKVKPRVWQKFIGAGIGFVTMGVIFFAFLTPVFGVMNVCNKFIENRAQTSNTQVASALSSENLMGGRLYFTDNQQIGQVETYLSKYDEIKSAYDKSPAGVVFNALGISKLGGFAFEYLTTTEHDDLKLNLTNEVVVIARAYDIYREDFVEKSFDITQERSVEDVQKLYNTVQSSEIVKEYMKDLLPVLCQRWSNGEKFMGFELPVQDNFKGLISAILEVFNTKNIDRVNANVNAIFETVKVLNKDQTLEKIVNEKMDFIDYLEWCEEENAKQANKPEDQRQYKRVIYDLMVKLGSTTELKNSMPKIFNEVIKVLCEEVVGGDKDKIENDFKNNTLTNDQLAQIVIEDEANILQAITDRIVTVLDTLNSDSENKTDMLINNIATIGEVIDYARQSRMLNTPLKTFITEVVGSSTLGLDSNIAKTMQDLITDKWTDTQQSYKNLFKAIQTTLSVVKDLSEGVDNLKDLDEDKLKDVLGGVVSSVDSETVSDILDNVVGSGSLGGDLQMSKETLEDVSSVVGDLLESVKKNSTNADGTLNEESLAKDAKAVKELLDVVQSAKDGNFNLGSDEEVTQKAEQVVDALVDSDSIMDMLESATTQEGEDKKPLKKYFEELQKNSGDDNSSYNAVKDAVQETIDELAKQGDAESNRKKDILEKFFGLDTKS